MLYPNRTIGYDFQDFKQLLPKNKIQGGNNWNILNKIKQYVANKTCNNR